MKTKQCYWSAIAAVALYLLATPAPSHAGIIIAAASPLNTPGTLTINFANQPEGATQVGDTVGGAPNYSFNFTTSDAGVNLSSGGSKIENATAANGFHTLMVAPQLSSIGFTYLDFQANSAQHFTPSNSDFVLTVTYVNSLGVESTTAPTALKFPWEGDNGQNQHYYVQSTAGDVMTKLSISYKPLTPDPTNNVITDIHNWDVLTAAVPAVPEPTSLVIMGLGLACWPVVRRMNRPRTSV